MHAVTPDMKARGRRIQRALPEWLSLLGPTRVLRDAQAQRLYGPDTSPDEPPIPVALQPETVDEVIQVVRIAAAHAAPLHPVSTGRNWGYGGAHPATWPCALVDLSRLRRIIALDEELGLVTVEPGVTQGDLRAFLDARRLPFLVPVTGAGPGCSLMGNVLERGYGITPHADHFLAMTSLEAVLPSGELYRSPLAELGAEDAARAFKWGVGPYLDGLFAQGGFGLVTRMTLALARRPECIQSFFFWLEDDADLEGAVVAVREVLREVGAHVGGINLMNAQRVLAMSGPPSPDSVAGPLGGAAWTGTGALYGTRRHVAATRALLRRRLRPQVHRLLFLDEALARRVSGVLEHLPGRMGAGLAQTARKLLGGLELMAGRPAEVALPLAYWRARVAPGARPLHPARDGCGLYWYSPIVPARPERVRAYVRFVQRICGKHGLATPLTFTSLSERAFDSTLPLLFARHDAAEAARALACYEELFDAGLAEGFAPYRVGRPLMSRLADGRRPFWRMVGQLKAAVDPDGILDPGRYAPVPFTPERQRTP